MAQSKPEMTLAIDVSLDQLDVALRSQSGEWLWPHQAYRNTWTGYQALKADLLAALGAESPVQLTAVGESTGPYWWHVFYHLSHEAELAAYEPQLALLNPLHVKRFRQALPEADKNDLLDPQLIAGYYRAIGVKHLYQFNERYLPLRAVSRAYARLTHTLAAEKAFLLSVLYLSCSDYQRQMPFSDLFGATSSYVLTEYADMAAIAELELEPLSEQLQQIAKGTLPDPDANARRLQQVAQEAYPVPQALADALHQVLKHTLAHIRFLSDTQKAYQALIRLHLDHLPEARPALEIPGLGPVLVAGFLAEIQDTQRFTSGTKFDRRRKTHRPRTYRDGQAAVAKLAGLWWPERASGRFQAQDLHLSRERNPYLRYWFVQAAHTLQRYQADYRAYYRRKYTEAQHHHHKRALLLTARKAVRLVFALLHKGQRAALGEAASA